MRVTIAMVIVLAALLISGLYQLTTPTPALISAGLVIAAAAPLAFVLATLRGHPPAGRRRHPVLVSVVTGFGCVMSMVGIHRFGDEHQWMLVAAFGALCCWMAWQKWCWRNEIRQ